MHNHVDVELPYDVTFVSEEHHLDPDGADAHLFGDVRRASAAPRGARPVTLTLDWQMAASPRCILMCT